MTVQQKEKFVDDAEAKRITGTIFIVIGCMGLAAVVSFLLYWAYTTSRQIFSGILWTFVFIYSVINVTFIAVSKSRLKPIPFRFFIALHSIFGLMSMTLFIFYFVRGSQTLRPSYGYNPSPIGIVNSD